MAGSGKPLSGRDLDALLRKMRAGRTPSAAPRVAARSEFTDFESHPAYQQMKLQRAFAEHAGFEDPYYRIHNGRAGATSLIGGERIINFASYDYLGLNGHAEVLEAVASANREFGTSVSASRISAGERRIHQELETALARHYGAEDCVVFVSGHAAAVSTIATLLGPKDLIVYDEFIHNCVVTGAVLSGAARRTFAHNDLASLEGVLLADRPRFERVLIVSEGLFSMDGDGPDLERLIELKHRHAAILMMDEAHALGVLGATGKGLFEQQGVDPQHVDFWFGTLSKSLVSCGGYVAGSAVAVDLLKHHAPGFVYSVGMPAGTAAASLKALEIMGREPQRVTRLQSLSKRMLAGLQGAGLNTGSAWGAGIVPLYVGDTIKVVALSQALLKRGVNAFPVLPPGVPDRTARLRFFVSASHTDEQIDASVEAVAATARSEGVRGSRGGR